MGGKSLRILGGRSLALAAVPWLSAGASATVYTWLGNGNVPWSNLNPPNVSGWTSSGGTYPHLPGDIANLTANVGANQTISIDVANAIVGELYFGDPDGSHNWSVSFNATNKLFFDNGASNAVLTKNNDAGNPVTDKITAGIQLNSNLVVTNLSSNKTLWLAGVISGSGKTITIANTSVGVIDVGDTGSSGNVVGSSSSSWIVNGGTLRANFARVFDNEYIKVNTGGVVSAMTADNMLAGLSAATTPTIELAGGTFRFPNSNEAHTIGGNFKVTANSSWDHFNQSNANSRTNTFGSLNFGPGSPTLSVTDSDSANDSVQTTKFVGSIIRNSGTINTGTDAAVELNNLAVVAGQTLTKAGAETLTLSGTLGVRLAGSADVLSTNVHTLVSRTAGTLAYSSPTGDASLGLWSLSAFTNNTDLVATLANNKGTVAIGSSLDFGAAEDAGYVTITGFLPDQPYTIDIDLVGTFTLANVMAELSTNPRYTSVGASPNPAFDVRVAFDTGPSVPGTQFFAWDNVPGHSLGADVRGLRPLLVPEPASVLWLGAMALVGSRRRGRDAARRW